jgi:hypothetical protein
MFKTSTITWDNKKGQETGLFYCILIPNRKKRFSPLALANLKGLPKLRQSSETEKHEKNTTDLFIDSIFEQCPTACSNDPTLF